MTQPIGVGFPDFGRYVANATKIYVDQAFTNITAFTNLATVYVGDVTHFGVKASADVGGVSLRLNFYDTSTFNSLLGDYRYQLRNTAELERSYPVVGPWLNIAAEPSGASSNMTLKVFSARELFYGDRGRFQANRLMSNNNTAVGAAATVSNDSTLIWDSEAYWSCFTALATWTAELYALDSAGAATLIARKNQTNGNFTVPMFLTPTTMRYSFINNTAAAGTFTMSLMARPSYPGA